MYKVILFVVIFFFMMPFIVKVKTECKTQYGACPAELESRIKNLESKNLYLTKQKISKYLKNNFLITDFSMQFKLPNILLVNVLIKKPTFAILNKDTNEILLLDKNGKVLSKAQNTSLPTVIQSGSTPNILVLNIMSGVFEMYQVNIGKIENDSLVVELPSGIKVIFPMDGDAQVLLGSLRLVYGKIESSDQKNKYKEIDLRFKNPILK